MSAAKHLARAVYVRIRLLVLVPLIVLSGPLIGVIIGIFGALEAIDEATDTPFRPTTTGAAHDE